MRIAMIAPFAVHPKGTTRWRVLPLARALASAGHTLRVFVPAYDQPAHAGRRWRDGMVEVVNLPLPPLPGAAGHAWLATSLALAVRNWQPTVVHSFKPKAHSGLAAWLLMRWVPRLPVVQDVDDWETGWNRRLAYPGHWQSLFAWQERAGIQEARAVTAASQWLVQEASAGRASTDRVFYLPNGVFALPPYQATPRAPGPKRVLLYTRFVEHSANDVWLVWREILARTPRAQLWVVGEDTAGQAMRLVSRAEDAGAGGSIRLLGWVPAATRAGLFAAVDAAVLPVADTPLNRAKSPMRLLDLMSSGVPVAAHAVGEYAAYIKHGKTGLLAAPGDELGLAAEMAALLADPEWAKRLAQGARQHIRQNQLWTQLAGTALAAYETALFG